MLDGPQRLRGFVCDLTRFSDAHAGEAAMLEAGAASLRELVAQDDWLPDEFAVPDPAMYRQYLLYCDPLERFSVVSFVWGPGQRTPVHDHTVWGLIGMLRGSERSVSYDFDDTGRLLAGAIDRLTPGAVTAVSPRIGDIHRVENAFSDRPSISIHVYGCNIGAVARHVFSVPDGTEKPFVSGYSNKMLPNLWDRSAEIRSQIGLVA
jgi:predicted metal-dependent enzyme (double-stranded beta helix superfamily)